MRLSGPSPAGGPVVPGPPIWNLCPPFHIWSPGCCIHPIHYFKNVASPFGFWPLLLVFGPPAVKSWRLFVFSNNVDLRNNTGNYRKTFWIFLLRLIAAIYLFQIDFHKPWNSPWYCYEKGTSGPVAPRHFPAFRRPWLCMFSNSLADTRLLLQF